MPSTVNSALFDVNRRKLKGHLQNSRLSSEDLPVYLVRMTPFSPLDALGPAFRRTREVLAAPFRLGFFLKIALIAALTQPTFYSATISYPIRGGQIGYVMGHSGSGSGLGYSEYDS